MKKMIRAMLCWDEAKQALSNQRGQGMVEYGLILALVAVVAIAGLLLLGPKLSTLFTDTAGKL